MPLVRRTAASGKDVHASVLRRSLPDARLAFSPECLAVDGQSFRNEG